MTVFLSTFRNKIDKKGRVSVPSAFRTILAQQTFQGVVVFPSLLLPAVEAMAMDRMERLSQHLDTMELFSQEQENMAAGIFADAQPLSFDTEGRIMLPESICQHAQLREEVAFVGRGPTFQIWNPEAFLDHQIACRQQLKHRGKLELGVLQPAGSAS